VFALEAIKQATHDNSHANPPRYLVSGLHLGAGGQLQGGG